MDYHYYKKGHRTGFAVILLLSLEGIVLKKPHWEQKYKALTSGILILRLPDDETYIFVYYKWPSLGYFVTSTLNVLM